MWVSADCVQTTSESWRAGVVCTRVNLRWLIAGVKRAGLEVLDISFASGSASVLGCDVSPAMARCSGSAKELPLVVQNSGRAVELVKGHESFLEFGHRGAVSIFDDSFKIRASVEFRGNRSVQCGWSSEPLAGSCLFVVSNGLLRA